MQNQNKFHYKAMMFLSFAGPAVILFSAVVIVPFIFGLYLTFTGWDGISSSIPFVGFENYLSLFKDTSFWISLGRTILYAVIAVILANLVAFALAYLVTSKIKEAISSGRRFFTPNLIGGIVLGYIWQFVFKQAILVIGKATGISCFPLPGCPILSKPSSIDHRYGMAAFRLSDADLYRRPDGRFR